MTPTSMIKKPTAEATSVGTNQPPNSKAGFRPLETKLQQDLCEDSLPGRVRSWLLLRREENPPSWTGTITKRLERGIHYITCPGYREGVSCTGLWNRRERGRMVQGLHCVFGGWVLFDGREISDVLPDPATGIGRSLKHLRHIWAEHVLPRVDVHAENRAIWEDESELENFKVVLSEGLAQKRDSSRDPDSQYTRVTGRGSGGWLGMSEDGKVVLKRDPGDIVVCGGQARCDAELGGFFQPQDIEVWTAWHGLSALVTRDGRWRPGYHLEQLNAIWVFVIDYASTREKWRNMDDAWMQAVHWSLVCTPPDIPSGFAQAVRDDVAEMIPQELQRYHQRSDRYALRDASSPAKQYRLLLDRAGNTTLHHTLGEPLKSFRSWVTMWALTVPNDIIDYERDVLCGETNNMLRSLTSTQQVVDGAGFCLEALLWATDNKDYDVVTSIIGLTAFYAIFWRYNVPKMAGRYPALSIRNQDVGVPPEFRELFDAIHSRDIHPTPRVQRYGELYERSHQQVQEMFNGCTCNKRVPGHDTWELLSRAFDEGGNDELEQKALVGLVELSHAATGGDMGSECGLDILGYEAFVRFFNPDIGIVARMHYRTRPYRAYCVTE